MSRPVKHIDGTVSYPEFPYPYPGADSPASRIDGPAYPAPTERWDVGTTPSEEVAVSAEENTKPAINVSATNFKGIQFFVKNRETGKLYGVLSIIDVYAECRFVAVDMTDESIIVSSAVNFRYPFSSAYNCTPKTRIST